MSRATSRPPVTAAGPTTGRQRHTVLDALRGMALLGIALANYPEFALWTFLSPAEQNALLEWVWRMLTYGRYFPLQKRSEPV